MAKISKTYTIEEETLKIVKENKEDRKLSSDSASLERIVLEWAILKGSNTKCYQSCYSPHISYSIFKYILSISLM